MSHAFSILEVSSLRSRHVGERLARGSSLSSPTAIALTGDRVCLRELAPSDAPALLTLLSTGDVARLISAPPTTIEGFERFIDWSRRERERGGCVCLGVVPHGMDTAVGVFQIRALEPGFITAEWGFAIGSAYWGTGVFLDAAKRVLEYLFTELGVRRLEARSAVANGRGNGALRKLGAVQEGVLRQSFLRNGQWHDQLLWSILESDWRQARGADVSIVHVH